MVKKVTLAFMVTLLITQSQISLLAQQSEYVSFQERADLAQQSLTDYFWDEEYELYNQAYKCEECHDRLVHYWWFAHTLDVLVDGYERTGNNDYLKRASIFYDSIYTKRGNEITIDFYDDMLWMALALLRLHEHTGDQHYEEAIFTLWEDVLTGWNDEQGGGIAWNKNQMDYKNTPSNAPAVILAARLYQIYGDEAYLEWAHKIYDWQRDYLVDPIDGFVWDGINRTGDETIDKDWAFTYNQGVYIGASLDLYNVTGDPVYLRAARQTARASIDRLTNVDTGLIIETDDGDGGLFKGIYVRYLGQLIETHPIQDELIDDLINLILVNADSAWQLTKDNDEILFGASWEREPELNVELSQHLSGVKVIEQAAKLTQADDFVTSIPLQQLIDLVEHRLNDAHHLDEDKRLGVEVALNQGISALVDIESSEEDFIEARRNLFEVGDDIILNQSESDGSILTRNLYLLGAALFGVVVIAIILLLRRRKKK